ncbi:MAG TPA: hypothetical protein VLJ39_09740 [Tepidisphaeraceae bacterium]|nr:hypothetical protein [Tepidisphaeraceae bacterium]
MLTETHPQRSPARRAAPAIVSALAALLVYACTLGGTYIYDDGPVIHDDPRMTHPGLWYQFFTRPYTPSVDKLYRPLTSLSFAIQQVAHGDRPWAFHLVNWILHAAAAAAVAELGYRLAGARVAWMAGMLFAVHPAHVEAVAGLVGRSESLCTLATVSGLCLFLGRSMTPGRILGMVGCFVVALLSKEQGMLFPLLVLALVPVRRARISERMEKKQRLWLTLSLCYVLAGYIFLRELTFGFFWDRAFLEWAMNPMVRSAGIDRVLMPVVLIGRYFLLLVAPRRQALDYGGYAIGWKVDPHDPFLYLGFLVLVGWLVLLGWSVSRRRWALMFCLLALAITYGMIGNIVAIIGTIFAERLIYLPSAFFVLLVAMGIAKLPRIAGRTIAIALILLGGIATFSYARVWNDPRQLFELALRNQPRSERTYALLFGELSRAGQWEEARRVAGEAIRAAPDSDAPYGMRITADLKLADFADARRTLSAGMSACEGFDRLALVPYVSQISQAASATQPSP